MSIALTLAAIVYTTGIIAYVGVGAAMIWDGKDDMRRYQERRLIPTTEEEIHESRRKISFGLDIVKGGFIVWPLLLTRSIKRNLREAERYTR